MVALSRNVPRKRAMEMLLLGEMLPAAEAAEYGLINRAVPASDVMEAALALARSDRIEVAGHAGDRQSRILRANRKAARGCLYVCCRYHGAEHDAKRRRGRHQCVSRKAQTGMEGLLIDAASRYPHHARRRGRRPLSSVLRGAGLQGFIGQPGRGDVHRGRWHRARVVREGGRLRQMRTFRTARLGSQALHLRTTSPRSRKSPRFLPKPLLPARNS